MRRIQGLLTLVCVCASPIWAQAKRPAEVEGLVQAAQGLPPEFAADLLLRTAASSLVKDRAWKVEIYESAFNLAASVQSPVMGHAAAHMTDSRERFQALAAGTRLDTLSIQCRAILGILPIDPAKARKLFAAVALPKIPKLECTDALVPDPSIYYETLGALAERAFTPKEKADEEHLRAVTAAIGSISSPAQVAAAARMLVSIRVTPQQLELLAGALVARIADLADDDRSYAFALHELHLDEELARLSNRLSAKGGAASGLAEAWQTYQARVKDSKQCVGAVREDAFQLPAGGVQGTVSSSINPNEAPPSDPSTAIHLHVYPVDDKARQFSVELRGLWMNGQGVMIGPQQKMETAWQSKALDYLNELDGWNSSEGASAEDVLHERAGLYRSLLQVAPPSDFQGRILESYVAFLAQSPLETSNPAEWLVELHSLLDLGRTPAAVGRTTNLTDTILREMSRSNNAVMSLYATLERQSSLGYGEWRGNGI